MAAELKAFIHVFEVAYTLAAELCLLYSESHVPVNLHADSKSLFDVISKGTRTCEKQLMIDIACGREGFKET